MYGIVCDTLSCVCVCVCDTAARVQGGAAATGLPAGWVERQCKRSGRTFYANTLTKASSWTVPTAAAVAASKFAAGAEHRGGLPAGWVRRTDPSSGKTFYANTATKETRWTWPHAKINVKRF